MMNTNGLSSFTNSLSHNVSDWAAHAYHEAGKLAGRTLETFQTIPHHMRADPKVAIFSFLVVNAVAFGIFHSLAQYINTKWIENPGHEGKTLDEIPQARSWQRFIIGSGVAACLYLANAGFARLTHYPVSRMILAGIVAAEVAFHAFLLYVRKKEDGKKEETSTPPTQPANNGLPSGADNKSVDNTTPPANQGNPTPQTEPQNQSQQNDSKKAVQDDSQKGNQQASSSGTADPKQAATDQGHPAPQNSAQDSQPPAPQQQSQAATDQANVTPQNLPAGDTQPQQTAVIGGGTPDTSTASEVTTTAETTPTVSFEDKVKKMKDEAKQAITNKEQPLTAGEKANAGIILKEPVPASMSDAQKKQDAIQTRDNYLLANKRLEAAKKERQKLLDAKSEKEEELRKAIQNYETQKHEYRFTARKAIKDFPFSLLNQPTVTAEVDEPPLFEIGEEATAEKK